MTLIFKRAQEAEDAILDKIVYPVWVQPKIDGVRAWNPHGTLVGRSMDPFKGYGITEYFSQPHFMSFDGEMTLGSKPCGEGLCRLTTGAMGRFKDVIEMADLHWHVFDYLCKYTINLPYSDRYMHLQKVLDELNHPRLWKVPFVPVYSRAGLNTAIADCFDQDYEGAIIRNPRALFKEGRATQKNQELWRVKPWADAEMLVTGITQGNTNTNEAKKNTLGRTERSSAKEGLVPNGQVGSIQGILIKDVHCPFTNKLLFKQGQEVTAGAGEMTQKERKYYWENPGEIVGHYAKIRHMTHGVKTQPRFPTFMSIRLKEDMPCPHLMT